jgi:hypothetical protein
MIHPLINPESAGHYDAGKKTAIEQLEQRATVMEQIGWCKGNIFKYRHRHELKGEAINDLKKMETYEAYLELLESMGREAVYMRVFEAYQKYGINIEYGGVK